MDFYTFSLLLGAIGLGAMAVGGIGMRGHGGTARSHAHGPSHAGGVRGAVHGAASAAKGAAKGVHAGARGAASRLLGALMSPRVLFSVLLGIGATGMLARGVLGGGLLFGAALAGGLAFERLVVTPVWNLAMRFASQPALTLESCVTDDATAVTAFDANGQGLVAVELDGQVIQVLATLDSPDRAAGIHVRAGDRVRIEAVDAQRNRCTVSTR
jgi:translation initiation factor IF-1